jgi:uncharacterized protein YgiM (DUF1202 family)
MQSRRILWIVFVLSLGVALIPTLVTLSTDSAQTFGTDWTANYWNNTGLTGLPAASETLPGGLDLDYGTGSPAAGVNDDNWSARFTSTQAFAAGDYVFVATSDDGVRVFIDGVLVLDRFVARPLTTDAVARTLTAGAHTLTVEFVEFTGNAYLQFYWITTAEAGTLTPTASTTPTSTNTGTAGPSPTNTNTATNTSTPTSTFTATNAGAGPEIEITADGVAIVSSPSTVINLGNTGLGVPLVRNFTITNTGTSVLTLDPPTIDPPFLAEITGPTTLNTGETANLAVGCFSEGAGSFSSLIRIGNNDGDESPFVFNVTCTVGQQPSFTPAPSLTASNTPSITPTSGTETRTLVPTFPVTISPIFFTPSPTLVPTFTPFPTFVFTPVEGTPPPRPQCAGQVPGPFPPTGVTVLVNRDDVNVRLYPAIGAQLIGFVDAGYTVEAEARSGDNEWVRVQFAPGQEGWLGLAVLTVLAGDVNTLPVADPRSIPYGGFEAPRAGITQANGPVSGRLEQSGLRVRSGPSRNYVVLANAPRYTVFPLLGRTVDNRWVQVNFEGTLGWVATEFVQITGDLNSLPIDGICADGVPISEPTDSSYFGTLRFLQSRLDLAQPSLDAIRAIWTNIALNGQAQCGNYPARPTNFNIPTPLLSVYFDRLNPLQTEFNQAMTALREAIDYLIEACNFSQPPAGLVGSAQVSLALDAVNRADALFASVRRRLTDLLPPDREVGPDECLFVYQARAEIIRRLEINQPRNAQLTTNRAVEGFCFDAPAGVSLRLEILRLSGESSPLITVSSFDNPTNFITSQSVSENLEYQSISPILIPNSGRYLVLISDLEGFGTAQGDFVILLTNITGVTAGLGPSLSRDPATGQIIVNPNASPIFGTPGISTPIPGFTPGVSASTCPSFTATCEQLAASGFGCAEALACFAVNRAILDPDGNLIPCDQSLCRDLTSP